MKFIRPDLTGSDYLVDQSDQLYSQPNQPPTWATEGGIFDATVYQSPKTGPKQTQTGSKTAQNSSKRVSKKYPLEGRAFGKAFTWRISSDFMQKKCIFAFF